MRLLSDTTDHWPQRAVQACLNDIASRILNMRASYVALRSPRGAQNAEHCTVLAQMSNTEQYKRKDVRYADCGDINAMRI